jgi:putative RecB family exonuclease
MDHLSASSIAQLVRCARQFYLARIVNIPVLTTPEQALGRAFHTTLAANFRHKAKIGMDLAADAITAEFDSCWAKESKGELDWRLDGQSSEQTQEQGRALVRTFHSRLAPHLTPAVDERGPLVERGFRLHIQGIPVPIIGVWDLVDASGAVVDFKSSGKKWSASREQEEKQPSIYLLARLSETGVLPSFRYCIVTKTKTPDVQVIEAPRAYADLAWFVNEELPLLWRQIEAGVFPPNTSGWWCSPQWCSMWQACRGRTQKTFALGAVTPYERKEGDD